MLVTVELSHESTARLKNISIQQLIMGYFYMSITWVVHVCKCQIQGFFSLTIWEYPTAMPFDSYIIIGNRMHTT